MRLTVSEKQEIIHMVTRSEIGVNRTLREIGIHKSTFYNWYHAYSKNGVEGLIPTKRASNRQWNSIPQEQKNLVVKLALDYPDLSSSELAYKITDEQQIFLSESSVYRILKARGLITAPAHIFLSACDEFTNKTGFVHQMWQTDFTYFKILGWGWYYLSTVLDDYSRYIVHWELCSNMKADDVKKTVDMAIKKAKLITKQKPKLLSDNGSCYVANELKSYLKDNYQMDQIHGRPNHPQTQGKIERYHRTMKNVVKLDNYFAPKELEAALEKFVYRYNNQRYHESLNNLTPADVYFGRGELILKERERLKKIAIVKRKIEYQKLKLTTNQKNLLSLNL
jgi:putative transposase